MTDPAQCMRDLNFPHVLYFQDRAILRHQLLHHCHGNVDMGRIVVRYPNKLSSDNAEILSTCGQQITSSRYIFIQDELQVTLYRYGQKQCAISNVPSANPRS